jgi:hypothetical protein
VCRLTYMKKTQRRHAINVTNLKLLTYVYCKVIPRVWVTIPQGPEQFFQTDIKTSQKASNGNLRQLHWPQNEIHNIRVCTSVGKNKMIIGYMDLKNKIVPYYMSVLMSLNVSCTDLVHVPPHCRLFTTHSWCDWNSKQQWDKEIIYIIYKFTYKK